MTHFPDYVDDQQIAFFKEMVSYEDDDESDAEDDTPPHIDTAVIQIKEVYPELGNLFVTGILNIIRSRTKQT